MQERTVTIEDRNAPQAGEDDRASPTSPDSLVDDHTYNVLQALASTLDAIEAYELYTEDDDSGLFEDLLGDERRHAERLVDELKGRLQSR